MYWNGQGVSQDNLYAHMWLNIAASNGEEDEGKLRDIVAEEMTAAQIEKAEELALEFIGKVREEFIRKVREESNDVDLVCFRDDVYESFDEELETLPIREEFGPAVGVSCPAHGGDPFGGTRVAHSYEGKGPGTSKSWIESYHNPGASCPSECVAWEHILDDDVDHDAFGIVRVSQDEWHVYSLPKPHLYPPALQSYRLYSSYSYSTSSEWGQHGTGIVRLSDGTWRCGFLQGGEYAKDAEPGTPYPLDYFEEHQAGGLHVFDNGGPYPSSRK
jgi:hypothetical protein